MNASVKNAKSPASKIRLAQLADKVKEPRDGSKRADLLKIVSRDGGVKLPVIQKRYKWKHSEAVEAIALLRRAHGIDVRPTAEGNFMRFGGSRGKRRAKAKTARKLAKAA